MLALASCGKHSSSQPPTDSAPATSSTASPAPARAKLEACGLLKREEIEAIQGSRVTDEKSTENADQDLRASQCYFSAEQANRSVSLAVTQGAEDASGNQRLLEYWNRMFKEPKEEEEGEKRVPPKKIENVGEEAYWVGSRVGGTLYVLKNGAFIRLSLGGPDNEETKIDKTKKLAAKVLERL